MPWTDPRANSSDLKRCIRDLVALSTLPAAWQNYDMRQIGSSIVAALISMLDADFVFIALPDHDNQFITELTRSSPKLDPADLKHVRSLLQQEKATLSSGQAFVIADASGGSDLHVITTPIGFGADATLAAGSVRDTFPTRTERLLLNTGANQAAIAFQHWLGDAEKRRFTALVQRTTDFVGIASLGGQIQYVNPAGLQLMGLDALDNALRLHVLDFVSPQYRQTVQDEIWPLVLRTGRWKGELDLRHFGSGAPISFLVDCFRIDDPRSGEPMNVATVSRDLSEQKASEAALRHLNESLERHVEERTFELADANNRLVAEKIERAQADLRFQKLQNELFHAARLTAAGQMAAARLLSSAHFEPVTFDRPDAFLAAAKTFKPGCVLLDVRLPDMSGLDVQAQLLKMRTDLAVNVVTGQGDIQTAVRAMKAGAADFLENALLGSIEAAFGRETDLDIADAVRGSPLSVPVNGTFLTDCWQVGRTN
jgi:PAS domain S-box-containing protein